MTQYLLSLHAVEGENRHADMTPEDMQGFMDKINALEVEMRDSDAFVFTGGLQGPSQATVVRFEDDSVLTTDGPFVEAKEHIAGFYVITADDPVDANMWAAKVADVVGAPIEVRPFFDSRGS
ncbi:MAG: YciI family protein [Acidimicrobiia bacterium]